MHIAPSIGCEGSQQGLGIQCILGTLTAPSGCVGRPTSSPCFPSKDTEREPEQSAGWGVGGGGVFAGAGSLLGTGQSEVTWLSLVQSRGGLHMLV